jgi:MoaA/NifB/PqqE/SkfB family radical SAM enzyme
MKILINSIRDKYRYSIIASIYRFFRYSSVDTVRNRFFYTLISGRIKKALYYPFKSIMIRMEGRPKAIIIDTVSVCNLRCPMCSVPPDISRKSTESKYMNIDKYKNIIDNINGYVTDLTLVYSGEPLLHPKFIDIVRYPANDYYITTISNATVFKNGVLDAILKYVDIIFFSYDGFSKESFEKYRIGADFDEVTKNIENLLIERKKYRMGIPIVILTWLVV